MPSKPTSRRRRFGALWHRGPPCRTAPPTYSRRPPWAGNYRNPLRVATSRAAPFSLSPPRNIALRITVSPSVTLACSLNRLGRLLVLDNSLRLLSMRRFHFAPRPGCWRRRTTLKLDTLPDRNDGTHPGSALIPSRLRPSPLRLRAYRPIISPPIVGIKPSHRLAALTLGTSHGDNFTHSRPSRSSQILDVSLTYFGR